MQSGMYNAHRQKEEIKYNTSVEMITPIPKTKKYDDCTKCNGTGIVLDNFWIEYIGKLRKLVQKRRKGISEKTVQSYYRKLRKVADNYEVFYGDCKDCEQRYYKSEWSRFRTDVVHKFRAIKPKKFDPFAKASKPTEVQALNKILM